MKNSSDCKRPYFNAPLRQLQVTQLQPAELIAVKGGSIAPILLGVPFAFKSIYDLGKALGRELYHIDHANPA